MFCSIILQPDRLSKTCMTLFFTKWPEMLKICKPLKCAQRVLFKWLDIFIISGHLVKKVSYIFLKDGPVV